jgi:hypothetical protein
MEVQVNDPRSQELLRVHNLDADVVHTNLEAGQCACRGMGGTKFESHVAFHAGLEAAAGVVVARPTFSGNSCTVCGGMMIRTGTCETCSECATTGGCG